MKYSTGFRIVSPRGAGTTHQAVTAGHYEVRFTPAPEGDVIRLSDVQLTVRKTWMNSASQRGLAPRMGL